MGSVLQEEFTPPYKLLHAARHPSLQVRYKEYLSCGCSVMVGIRVDNGEAATSAGACSPEHEELIQFFQEAMLASLQVATDKPLQDIVKQMLGAAEDRYNTEVAVQAKIVCDFCKAYENVHWDYPCADLVHRDPTYGFPFASAGGWLACDECHDLIEAEDWRGLAIRSAEQHKVPDDVPKEPVMEALKSLHQAFQRNRTGPVKEWPPNPREEAKSDES